MQQDTTHCSTLQHTATQCNTLQHNATGYNTLQHTIHNKEVSTREAPDCRNGYIVDYGPLPQYAATYCHTMQHSTKHCGTLQHTATHNSQRGSVHRRGYKVLRQHTATHCDTLQHAAVPLHSFSVYRRGFGFQKWLHSRLRPAAATCCNITGTATHHTTLQHTAPHCNALPQTIIHTRRCRCRRNYRYHKTMHHTATRCNTLLHTRFHQHKHMNICIHIIGLFCRIKSL